MACVVVGAAAFLCERSALENGLWFLAADGLSSRAGAAGLSDLSGLRPSFFLERSACAIGESYLQFQPISQLWSWCALDLTVL